MKFKNLDSSESIFFLRELEKVKSKSYDILYPDLKARSLFPVSGEAGPGAEAIVYEQYDQVGLAKLIANYADDLPRADVKGKEFVSRVKSIGDSYGYSIQEVRASKHAGKPLQQRKANAAKEAALRLENKIAFFGDAECGIGGFLTNANIGSYTLPNDGTGPSTKFSTKSAEFVLRDLNGMAGQIHDVSLGVESPDTLLLPLSVYNDLWTRRIPDTNISILKFFLENSPHIKQVEWVNELKNAGGAGVDFAIMYKRSPDKLTMEVPQDFEQFPVQEDNLEYKVPCHMRTGGVIIYYPLSVIKASGC